MWEPEFKLSKGDWVSHPRMPSWGYGKVLELIGDNKGRVFFLLAGEKKLSWEHAGLVLVEGDKISQTALNDQLVEFKLKLARDLLTSKGGGQDVACTPCESFGAKCELCKETSGILRLYSLSQRGKMCFCDMCRDKIILEHGDTAEVNQSITKTPKRSKKGTADRERPKTKLKIVKKRV
jgi:hypothetical protein